MKVKLNKRIRNISIKIVKWDITNQFTGFKFEIKKKIYPGYQVGNFENIIMLKNIFYEIRICKYSLLIYNTKKHD